MNNNAWGSALIVWEHIYSGSEQGEGYLICYPGYILLGNGQNSVKSLMIVTNNYNIPQISQILGLCLALQD